MSGKTFVEAEAEIEGGLIKNDEVEQIITRIIGAYPAEHDRYKAGEQQLFGFFMGQIMKETRGKVNPAELNKILKEHL